MRILRYYVDIEITFHHVDKDIIISMCGYIQSVFVYPEKMAVM